MLSKDQISKIKAAVEQAATTHLNAKDKDTALSHFTDDVIAVSNLSLFSSCESLAVDVGEYFKSLKEVKHASLEDVHIQIINKSAATFTAKFRYGFVNIEDQVVDLKGVWTALFVLDEGVWKIRLRHESFEQT